MIDKLRSLLAKQSFLSSVIVVAGGTAIGQAVVVLVSPLLTRLYQPADFGALSVFISLFSLLLISNSLRYELAIPLADDDTNAANIFCLVIVLVVFTTVILGVLFWLFGDTLFALINAPALKPFLWLLLLSLLAGGLYQALTFWALRKQAFNPIARSKFAQNFSMAAIQLGLGLISIGLGGLTFGLAVGQILGNLPLLLLIWKHHREPFKKVSLNGMITMAKRYRRFPLWTSWSAFLMTIGLQLPAILIVTIYGAEVGGWFALGQRVIGLPMALIGVSVGQVYVSRASQMINDNPSDLLNLYTRTSQRLFFIGILPIGLLTLIGPELFAIAFGDGWRTAGEYLQILAPMVLIQFVVSSVGQNIYVIERQDLQSIWDVLRLTIVIGTFVLSAYLKLTPHTALMLYAFGGSVAYFVLFMLNRYALKHFAPA